MNEIAPITPAGSHAVAAAEPPTLLSAIVRMASDSSIDVAKLQALLEMQQRLEARQAEAAFNAAHARVVAAMPRVPKNGVVNLGTGKGSYNFARWEDVDSLLRPLMQAEGFSLTFDSQYRDGGGAVVIATLLHAGGHSRQASIPLALDTGAGRNNLQAMGSTLSYGKRYLAEMLFNIVREGADDDGRSGGKQYLSSAQQSELLDLVAATSTDLDRFFSAMKIDAQTVAEIDTDDLPRLMNALRIKQQKMAAKP